MKKKILSVLSDGLLSGIMLCIGCAVSISVDSRPLGAFLFSIGLFAIIKLKFALFTGKAGYMVVNPPSYIGEVALTLVGNICGAALGGFLLNLTRFGDKFSQTAAETMSVKFADSFFSTFVLAVFCGILMFVAVEGNRKALAKGDSTGSLFAVVMPIMVFILSGFNHCVADLCNFFISRCSSAGDAPLYFTGVILGNAVGCMLIPFVKKLSLEKLNDD